MRDITFRTVGAAAVLAGLALAALLQASAEGPAPVEIDTMSPSSTSSPVTTGETVVGASTPTGLVYRIGLLSNVTTDNFWAYYDTDPTSWNAYVLGATKPALFAIDPATGDMTPDLAVGAEPPEPWWDVSGWHVSITWRNDVQWSDGAPITPADMVFTFETVRRLGLTGAWLDVFPPNVTGVVAESDDRIRLDFDHRPGLGDWPYGAGLAPVMPVHVWLDQVQGMATGEELMAADASSDVSGGPLDIVERSDTQIVARVDHQRSDSSVETVVFMIFGSEHEAADALAAGEIDTILSPRGLSGEVADRLTDVPGVSIERNPANSVRYLGFNLRRAPMSDKAFRTAVALLTDRDALTTSVVPDAIPAFTMISPQNAAWFDPDGAAAIQAIFAGDIRNRLDTALSVLNEAGYTWEVLPAIENGELTPGSGLTIDGQEPAPLTILTPGDLYDPARPEYAGRIAQVIEALGFEVRVVVTDFDTVVDLTFSAGEEGGGQYDMYLLGWTLGFPSYPSYYGPLFTGSGDANSTGYASRGFDNAWREFVSASSLEKARGALWRMEEILSIDLPYLPLYHPQIVEAFRSDRIRFDISNTLGGIQGRNGGLEDVNSAE